MPDDVRVTVPKGTTLLDSARQGGVYISSICGGDGICGKCKVVVREGEVDAEPTALLRREEIQQNYVLACMATVQTDAEILVPEETRIEAGKILVDEDAKRFGRISTEPAGRAFQNDTLVKKVPLRMSAPVSEDNLADYERLLFHLGQALGMDVGAMQMGYRVLRQLPSTLRAKDWEVTATVGHRGTTVEVITTQAGDTSDKNYGIAVDVGTTTVVAHLVSLVSGETLDAEATYNSQMQFGEDYIQRIIYAETNEALDEMKRSIVDDINGLVSTLVTRTEIDLHDVTCMVCAGNTAMIHFLLGLDPVRIRREPYLPSANTIPALRAAEVGISISGRGLLYCLPSVAAYVGSDITAGASAISLQTAREPTLFIDIGTNGEVVLAGEEWMMCCSASAGPAFEGSGVRHGMRAARGAIEKVDITNDGTVKCETIDNKAPRGICGSGLLDVIAGLFRAGLIERTGRLAEPDASERIRVGEDGPEFVLVWRPESGIDTDIVITQPDIDNLIRSKAAVYAAVSSLVGALEMTPDDIQRVYLAGGFGNYMNVESAITIGMLPDIPHERIEFVGNTSVAGARMALLSRAAFSVIQDIASRMTYFDLMGNPGFMDEFVRAKFIPHTDLERFPSVCQS